jgi:hypothetical protein
LVVLSFFLMGLPALLPVVTDVEPTDFLLDNEASVPGLILANLAIPNHTIKPSEELPMALRVVKTAVVGQLTGTGSLNDTVQWDVHGTDLGHMFWHRDRLYMVFGDTYGKGGRGGENWRSNTMARLADPDPKNGLRIETMILGPNGAAKELIPSRKLWGVERTVIPTHGISIDGRMYLHYMSVRPWGAPGHWSVRHSGFAYSDDDGATWSKPQSAVWPANTGFEQVAFVQEGDYVYTLGIPGGRFGGVRLRRVAPAGILDKKAYEYWDSQNWVAEMEAAAIIVPMPVGELSVAWSARYKRWLMMYLNPQRYAVMLRTALELTGPWGEEQVVVTAKEYEGLYAPYIVPMPDLGDDVYFTLSQWGPYNVFLLHTTLEEISGELTADASR